MTHSQSNTTLKIVLVNPTFLMYPILSIVGPEYDLRCMTRVLPNRVVSGTMRRLNTVQSYKYYNIKSGRKICHKM